MDFLLQASDLPALQAFLLARKWIAPAEEVLSATKPGEGNMNYTLRIRTNFRTFILKQSRPYVEKYPQIPAPVERAIIEGNFYERIQEVDSLRQVTPELTAMDPANAVIMLEDLGESSDFTFLYHRGATLDRVDLAALTDFLSTLHSHFGQGGKLPNRAMRVLNAEHIFDYPFRPDNGLDLDGITPGLAAVARRYQQDAALTARVSALSKAYLTDGNTLLHGDYYPGSWLRTLAGVRIIDPEFCFYGPAEFDLSVMIAHLHLSQQPADRATFVREQYRGGPLDPALLDRLTGVEIMRRLIGLAQLPLDLDLTEKSRLLTQAYQLLMT